jgi:hypothetical protein
VPWNRRYAGENPTASAVREAVVRLIANVIRESVTPHGHANTGRLGVRAYFRAVASQSGVNLMGVSLTPSLDRGRNRSSDLAGFRIVATQ